MMSDSFEKEGQGDNGKGDAVVPPQAWTSPFKHHDRQYYP